MPTTHSEWLTRVCGVCLGKNSDLRKISDSDLKLIKQFNQPDYDMERKPSVLCRSCYKTLQFISENGLNAGRNLPIIDYENLRLPVVTRQQQMYCDCIYCNVGRLNGQQYKNWYKSIRTGPGRPQLLPSTSNSPEVVSHCTKCLGKGSF